MPPFILKNEGIAKLDNLLARKNSEDKYQKKSNTNKGLNHPKRNVKALKDKSEETWDCIEENILRMNYRKKQICVDIKARKACTFHRKIKSRILSSIWLRNYTALKKYKDKHGDCFVPNNHPLRRWAASQRSLYVKNELMPKKVRMLSDIGFLFSDLPFQKGYRELAEYKKRKGHCEVGDDASIYLKKWTTKQRVLFNGKNLSRDKISLLLQIGLDLSIESAKKVDV